MSTHRSVFVAVTASALLLGGCQVIPEPQEDPTQFYVLTHPNATDLNLDGIQGITLGLHEIRLPVYLGDSRAMAVRNSGNRLTYRDFDRWAEPLDEGIERVLRISLSVTPEVGRVLTLPFPAGIERDYDLQVTVLAAEGLDTSDQKRVGFAMDYSLLTPDGELVTHGLYRAPLRNWDGTASDLAAKISQSIVDSTDVIAAAIAEAR